MLLRRYVLHQHLSYELNTSVGGYVIVLEVRMLKAARKNACDFQEWLCGQILLVFN